MMNGFIRCLCGTSSVALAVIGSASSAMAQAQSVQAQAEGAATQASDIVVTGSRVATAVNAPTPVTTVDTEQLAASSPTTIADALNQLPAFANSQAPTKGGSSLYGGNFLNLRSLGPGRSLILLDGQRLPTTSPAGSPVGFVNVDWIPAALVKQVDTVTGGASAAYGSDAVAGVVNFVLDHDFEGLKGEAQYGITSRGDNQNYKFGLSGGGSFADGRGHVLFSFEHAKSDELNGDPKNRPGKAPRDWARSGRGLIPNPNAGPGQPAYITIPDLRVSAFPLGGVVLSGAAFGTTFTPDGASAPYDFGTNVSGAVASGGGGYSPAPGIPLANGLTRTSAYGRVSYEFSEHATLYATLMYSRGNNAAGIGHAFTALISPSLSLSVDNAYLPDDVRTKMLANGEQAVIIGKRFDQLRAEQNNTAERMSLGGDGEIAGNWKWQAHVQRGRVTSETILDGNFDTINFAKAIDAVRAPDGTIVCRSTLTSPTDGCVPYNLLGDRPLTTEQRAYFQPTQEYRGKGSQVTAEASVSGPLFSTRAGEVSIAAGVGYRKEKLKQFTNQLAGLTNPFTGLPGAWAFLNQPALAGSFDVKEAFAEAQVPLLSDLPAVRSLDLNFAVRYSDYSTSGGQTTWKAGAVWSPVEGVRFRASKSRDARAPSVTELFSPSSSGFAIVRDPQNGNQSVPAIPVQSGNAQLMPEVGKTFTAGVVLQPSFVPGFAASIDYYRVKITNVISTLNPQQTVDQCAAGSAALCDLVTRDPTTNAIVSIRTPFLNLSSLRTSGIDFDVSYRRNVNFGSQGGILNLRLFATYVHDLVTEAPGSPAFDLAGDVGFGNEGVPHWTGLGSISYETGPWAFQLQEHYVGGGTVSNALLSVRPGSKNEVKANWWTDLTIRRSIGTFELYGTVANLFDQDPRSVATASISGPTNYRLYDTLGRRFVAGARFKF